MVELASILSFLTLPFVSEDRINIAQTGTYEVEGGALKGTQVENTAHGYTGAGYVAPYANSVRSLTVVVVVPSTPLYNIGVIYEAPYGDGCTSVTLNGTPNGKIYFPVSSTFTKMSGTPSEVGEIPDPDLLVAYDADWSHFVAWDNDWISGGSHNSLDFSKKLYFHDYTVNWDDIKGWKGATTSSTISSASSTSTSRTSSTTRTFSTSSARTSSSSRTSSSTRTSSTTRTSSSTRTSSTSTRSSSTSSTRTSSSSVATATQSEWGQCGGATYTGPTTCGTGLTCVAVSPPWYYQCLQV
ncbi:hypothetical protein CPB86DRAFT_816070 [Serendipita vermifera]|nr:hypothetical protein CPB86DRAFT_816070 [Serendipita vermifera]